MNAEERKKWGTILEKWTPFFIIACVFLGVVLGSFLIYFSQGEFPYVGFLVGLIVAVILTTIEVTKQQSA